MGNIASKHSPGIGLCEHARKPSHPTATGDATQAKKMEPLKHIPASLILGQVDFLRDFDTLPIGFSRVFWTLP